MPTFQFVLAGRYRLVAPLGEGGMAAVYRARDLRLNRDVAVKVLRDDLTGDPEFLARFEREAQVVAALSHPNIVPVYDVGEENGSHFIVMEYIRGRTLKETIEMEGRLPTDRTIAIMLRVLDALGYAHQHGLIHRDVKPQNILLTRDGSPHLADFGIAHLVGGSTTRTAAILGSAQYLSPEQARGEEAGVGSDIYACGIVLYEMLSGRLPFDGANALAIAHQHLHVAPPALGVSDATELEAVVMRALRKEARARFADTGDFAAALDAVKPAVLATSILPIERGSADERVPAVRTIDRRSERLVVRRSGRKRVVLAGVLSAVVAFAASVARHPILGYSLPAYPSAPYLIIPALLAAILLVSWLTTRSWRYVMDDSAAIVQWGLIGHHRFGIPLQQIATLSLKQSALDRLLGIGTVELYARDQHGADRFLIMEDLPHPRETYDQLARLLGRSLRRSGGNPSLPAPTTATSDTRTL